MKIVFPTLDKMFEVVAVYNDNDEVGVPVDIVIYADEKTLESISELASVGCNIRECEYGLDDPHIAMLATHCGLFARLEEFVVAE